MVTPRFDPTLSFGESLNLDGDQGPLAVPSRYLARGSLSAAPSDRFRQFSLASEMPYEGRSLAPSTTVVGTDRRPSANTQDSRRSSATQGGKKEPLPFLLPSGETDEESQIGADGVRRKDFDKHGAKSSRPSPGQSEEEEERDGDADGDWDLMQMLSNTAPPRTADDRFAPEGETIELVEESMASYLNRKTALLMLWFPLGVRRVNAVSSCGQN
jgi:hypothetical protein